MTVRPGLAPSRLPRPMSAAEPSTAAASRGGAAARSRRSATRPRPSLALLFAAVVLRTAWVSDDAFITFRTVDNALHGDGLRWNPAERVQTYTHPLWMLLLLATTAVTGTRTLSSLGLSFALTACAVRAAPPQRRRAHGPAVFALVGDHVVERVRGLLDERPRERAVARAARPAARGLCRSNRRPDDRRCGAG